VVSRRCRNTSLGSGGCVGIVSSGEEGAGASSAVGQASAFRGAAGSRVERSRRGPRSRGISHLRSKLVARIQDLSQRRHGGFVPPLDRLAVRQISTRYLSQDERIEIADLRRAGLSARTIAARLGRAPSTISRELRRNVSAGREYRPFDAHRRATARRAQHPQRHSDAQRRGTPRRHRRRARRLRRAHPRIRVFHPSGARRAGGNRCCHR